MRTLESILDTNKDIDKEALEELVNQLFVMKIDPTQWSIVDKTLLIDRVDITNPFSKALLSKIDLLDTRGMIRLRNTRTIKGGDNIPRNINCDSIIIRASRVEDINLCGCYRHGRSKEQSILNWVGTNKNGVVFKNVNILKTNQRGMNLTFTGHIMPDLRGLGGECGWITVLISNSQESEKLADIFENGDPSQLLINPDFKFDYISISLTLPSSKCIYVLHSKPTTGAAPFGKYYLKRIERRS